MLQFEADPKQVLQAEEQFSHLREGERKVLSGQELQPGWELGHAMHLLPARKWLSAQV